jgi:hypothetical protein
MVEPSESVRLLAESGTDRDAEVCVPFEKIADGNTDADTPDSVMVCVPEGGRTALI